MSLPVLNSGRAIALLALGSVVWAVALAAIIVGVGWPWYPALTDAALLSLITALACYGTHSSLYFFQPTVRVALLTAAVTVVFAYGLIQVHARVVEPLVDAAYFRFCAQTLWPRVLVAWLLLMMTAVPTFLWAQITDQREATAALKETEKLAREAELSNLRQRLQPHFIFNSLNSINALIGSEPEKARTMVQQVSDFLRSSLRHEEKTLITLREELHYLHLYLDIEKVRFGHRLLTEQMCDPAVLELRLPALLLQPIVENAIKFGLYGLTGEVVISLQARQVEGMLEVVIKNPYDPAMSDTRKGTGFGLSAVSRRLYLLYARNDLLHILAEGNQYIATLHIPQTP